MKICRQCNISKSLDNFSKDSDKKDGLRRICKICDGNKSKLYRQVNDAKVKAAYKIFYNKNKKKQRLRCKLKSRIYYKKNKKYFKAKSAKRRSKLLDRVVPCSNIMNIKQIYVNCPKGYEVDHIIPLQNKNISGLHVSWNLQYLTKLKNLSKANKFDGTYDNSGWKYVYV